VFRLTPTEQGHDQENRVALTVYVGFAVAFAVRPVGAQPAMTYWTDLNFPASSPGEENIAFPNELECWGRLCMTRKTEMASALSCNAAKAI
jgi:hypothetical protein